MILQDMDNSVPRSAERVYHATGALDRTSGLEDVFSDAGWWCESTRSAPGSVSLVGAVVGSLHETAMCGTYYPIPDDSLCIRQSFGYASGSPFYILHFSTTVNCYPVLTSLWCRVSS